MIVHCQRCHVSCRTGTPDPKARLLQLSAGPSGLCVNCAVTNFFQSVEPLRDILERDGVDGLRLEHIQRQFAAVMASGFAQVSPDQIDWLEIMANWDLPFPKTKARK